ncbi:MAG: peptidase S8, partial [Candidatus Nitrosomaritimum aestuariumsis]
LELKSLNDSLNNIDVSFEGPDFIQFSNFREGNNLKIRMNALEEKFGDYEGRIIVNQNEDRYVIPFLLHYTEASISTSQQDGTLSFEIYHPEEWSFAKISVTNSKDGSTETISTNPGKLSTMNVYQNGEYWIQTSVKTEEDSFDAFDVIEVNSVLPGTVKPFDWFGLPEKQIGIIAIVAIVIGLIGLKISRIKRV